MKLTKENVYVNLQGKTKEELTDLYWFLTSNGYKPYRDLESFLEYSKENFKHIGFSLGDFCGLGSNSYKNKTEVTIEQLKEILQPIDTLQQQLQKAEAEVKRLKEAIEDSKIKDKDWVYCSFNESIFKYTDGTTTNDLKKNNKHRTY